MKEFEWTLNSYYFVSIFCLHNKLNYDTIGSAYNNKICVAIQTDSEDCSLLAKNSIVTSLNLRIEKLESDLLEEKGNNTFVICFVWSWSVIQAQVLYVDICISGRVSALRCCLEEERERYKYVEDTHQEETGSIRYIN